MVVKRFQGKQGNRNQGRDPANHSSSCMVEYFDEERVAQREEFFRRKKDKDKTSFKQLRPKKARKTKKPKVMTFDQKLDLTDQWLEETYPHLFAADEYIPLDNNILQDLKVEYKNNSIKKGYPKDLIIKWAISRYRESLGYLESIKEGATRYNLKGEACGIITKEEEETARKILATL